MIKNTKSKGTASKQDFSFKKKDKKEEWQFVFNREKYILMLVGLIIIFAGLLLMIGGGTDDPNVFSDEIFSFRRLTLAPILIILGYIIEIYAIMKKDKQQPLPESNE